MKNITIYNTNNHKFEANLVLCFEVPEFDKKYIIYSFPSTNGEDILNVGTLKESVNNEYYITDLNNDAEWEFVKKVMMQMIKER